MHESEPPSGSPPTEIEVYPIRPAVCPSDVSHPICSGAPIALPSRRPPDEAWNNGTSEALPSRRQPDEAWNNGASEALPSRRQSDEVWNNGTSEVEKIERERLAARLQSSKAWESLTIATISSADSIPLGTDLDPQNGYNNAWAAKQIADHTARKLVQCNLCWRVIDAENVGLSYGEHLGKPGQYVIDGVRQAVDYFRAQGISVIVVTKRKELEKQIAVNGQLLDGLTIVHADQRDDLMVLRQAHQKNCPVVSTDRFTNWQKDLRVATEVREWMLETLPLQVRFSWGPNNNFITDFDLPRPSVQPSSSVINTSMRLRILPQPKACEWCSTHSSEGDFWRDWWYCSKCWKRWCPEQAWEYGEEQL